MILRIPLFYNCYILDDCSKYEGQVEDRNVNQAKSVDASCSYGGVQRPELASEDKASQKNSSKTDDLLCPEAYGIQKIIPTVSDVSSFESFAHFFLVLFLLLQVINEHMAC